MKPFRKITATTKTEDQNTAKKYVLKDSFEAIQWFKLGDSSSIKQTIQMNGTPCIYCNTVQDHGLLESPFGNMDIVCPGEFISSLTIIKCPSVVKA